MFPTYILILNAGRITAFAIFDSLKIIKALCSFVAVIVQTFNLILSLLCGFLMLQSLVDPGSPAAVYGNSPFGNYAPTFIIITIAIILVSTFFKSCFSIAVISIIGCFIEDVHFCDGSESSPFFMTKTMKKLMRRQMFLIKEDGRFKTRGTIDLEITKERRATVCIALNTAGMPRSSTREDMDMIIKDQPLPRPVRRARSKSTPIAYEVLPVIKPLSNPKTSTIQKHTLNEITSENSLERNSASIPRGSTPSRRRSYKPLPLPQAIEKRSAEVTAVVPLSKEVDKMETEAKAVITTETTSDAEQIDYEKLKDSFLDIYAEIS